MTTAQRDLDALERLVAAQRAAVSRWAPGSPDAQTVALLCAPAPAPDPARLGPADRVRLAAVVDDLQHMVDELSTRRDLVGRRLVALNRVRTGTPVAYFVDRRG